MTAKVLALLILFVVATAGAVKAAGPLSTDKIEITEPDAGRAARLMAADASDIVVRRLEGSVPGWSVSIGGHVAGYIGSTWEIANTVGYSGRPLDVLVAVLPDARIAGAELVRHNEPVLTLGISDEDIVAYVSGFRGFDLKTMGQAESASRLPPIISRATVSTGVIRDGILRTARALALGQGLLAGSGIDRISFRALGWDQIVASGALVHSTLSMNEASQLFAGADVPVVPGEGAFLDLFTGLVDPPAVGRNLLGQQEFTTAVGSLAADETALLIATSGVHSHRGADWKQEGRFARITIAQGPTRHVPKAEDYIFVKKLALPDAPAFKEISLFKLPPAIDPLQPFTVEIGARRKSKDGTDIAAVISASYGLPALFRSVPPAEAPPLWQESWRSKPAAIAVVLAMLAVLTVILFAQEWITRSPVLWRRLRLGYLLATFLVLGLALNGQLSVVQVIAFIHSLLNGFRWETFLIEPVIFMLWGFVALGLLFWGRGVYCGWLCPFGALQELLNVAAQRFGIRQVAVPQPLHERLWAIKYTLFVGILALSFYSMHDALIAAEVEPFKTAISMRMMRAWPFLLFVGLLLAAGLFIERFYCRYLCPLGAGIAIPAKLKIFDWLKRRPQCGRECRLCETKCTVGAIDALGRINPNECVLCLRCQVIMNDGAQCPVLKRRSRTAEGVPT